MYPSSTARTVSPLGPNCQLICLHCPSDSVQTTQISPITTTSPTVHVCKGVCECCLLTTPIPTSNPPPTNPSPATCKELCLKCSLKPSTTSQPKITDNCESICKNCQRTSTEITLPVTTAMTTVLSTSTPSSENCQQICELCLPDAEPTEEDQCRDICSKCTSSTALLVPGTPSCESLCHSCKKSSSLIPGSPQCIDICSSCKILLKLDCPALCDKCKIKPVPDSPQCKDVCNNCKMLPKLDCPALCNKCTKAVPDSPQCEDICSNCQPVVSPVPEDKCISCKILCQKCGFNRNHRRKRDIHYEAQGSLPLVVNIERVNRSEDPCETKSVNPLYDFNPGLKYKDFAQPPQKCKNTTAFYKSNDEICRDCYNTNNLAQRSEDIVKIDMQNCFSLCKKCKDKITLKPGSEMCHNVCSNCRNKNKPNKKICFDLCKRCRNNTVPTAKPDSNPYTPNQCTDVCKQCKNTTAPTMKPDLKPLTPNQCKDFCEECRKMNPPILKPGTSECHIKCQKCQAKEGPDPTTLSTEKPTTPNINDCLNLCNKCKNRTDNSVTKPNAQQCQTYCRICKDDKKQTSTTPAVLPDDCEKKCSYCKHLLTSPPPSPLPTPAPSLPPTLQPGSPECQDVCSQCKKPSGGKALKITRTNCTHSNVTD